MKNNDKNKYNCMDYRKEMTLLGLKKKLQNNKLSKDEKKVLKDEISKLEKEMGLE